MARRRRPSRLSLPGAGEQLFDDSKRLRRQKNNAQRRERERASEARPSLKLGGAKGCAYGIAYTGHVETAKAALALEERVAVGVELPAPPDELLLALVELRLPFCESLLSLCDGRKRGFALPRVGLCRLAVRAAGRGAS